MGMNPATKLTLATTSTADYASAVQHAKYNESWWYCNKLVPYRHASAPFQDNQGRWWYCVKPKFAYPIDFFTKFETRPKLPWGRAAFGWQYPVPRGYGNSSVNMNVIEDCAGYGIHSVDSSKRRAVRKGLKNLIVQTVNPSDANVQRTALEVWNSHVRRTGWNREYSPSEFCASWDELAAMPGTTVLAAFDPTSGDQMCAWLIVRIFEKTIWIDTIASHTDRQKNRPNDTLIFLALSNAGCMEGVRHAHYSLVSSVETLERFKGSLGFSPVPFESNLEVWPPARWAMKLFRPTVWQRLLGNMPKPSPAKKR